MSYRELVDKFAGLTLEAEDYWDYQGTCNSERDYVHGFCTYPAMMVPKMQREMLSVCLDEAGTPKPSLLDPFAGSGTILVEGMLRGLDVVAVDINPLAVLLCKAKSTIFNLNLLEQESRQLLTRIDNLKGTPDFSFKGIDKWFTSKAISDLSQIRAAITQCGYADIRRFYWATFCEIIRIVSNSRDCTYKLHIKDVEEIKAYSKDTVCIFKETLTHNIGKYKDFYYKLGEQGHLARDGLSYRGKIEIVLGDCVTYLNRTRRKFDLIFTSPPYGDNHTTVSYGQYSVLSLRWIDWNDIGSAVDAKLLETLYEIDNISLGGVSSNKSLTIEKRKVIEKSATLLEQVETINDMAPKQVNKLIAFYSDFDRFLEKMTMRIKPTGVAVWTIGNRRIARQEIFMNRILTELGAFYNMKLLTSFSRKILNKRMPRINAYKGDAKDLIGTMTREHILIFTRGENVNVGTNLII